MPDSHGRDLLQGAPNAADKQFYWQHTLGQAVAVDCETTGLDVWHGDQPFLVAFCDEDGERGYFRWEVDPDTRAVMAEPADLKRLQVFFADSSITKVFHNAAFDILMLSEGLGLEVCGPIEDTWIAAHVWNTLEPAYGLKELAKKYFEIDDGDERDLKQAVKRHRRTAQSRGWSLGSAVEADYWLPGQLASEDRRCEFYALRDVYRTMVLWRVYKEDVFPNEPKLRISYEFEIQLLPLLLRMEARGIAFDTKVNGDELRRSSARARNLRKRLVKTAGDFKFNPNSAAHVRRLLFDQIGLKPLDQTRTGLPKASQDAILAYRDNPTVRDLLKYRSVAKARAAYFEKFPTAAAADPLVPKGVCIHPHFIQAGKRTGRLSCASPNLQGVADERGSRSAVPIAARRPFGPRPGYRWYVFDYSQVEARRPAQAHHKGSTFAPKLQAAPLEFLPTDARDKDRFFRPSAAGSGSDPALDGEREDL